MRYKVHKVFRTSDMPPDVAIEYTDTFQGRWHDRANSIIVGEISDDIGRQWIVDRWLLDNGAWLDEKVFIEH